MASISLFSTFPFCPSLSPSPSKSNLSFPFHFRHFKPTCCLSLKQSNTPQKDTLLTEKDSFRVVFAAGGTGGHISPAVAIADELKIANPGIQVLFLGLPDSMESTSIPSTGFSFVSVPTPVRLFRPYISPRNLFLPYYLVKSLIQCHAILKDFDPHIVVGTGGYVSFPVCLAAFLRGTKVVIHEQNSVPGIANWVLSFLADKVFVAFNATVDCFPRKEKCFVCGNPVRLSLRRFVSKEAARLKFFPKSGEYKEAKVLLILGGSLGANAINIAVLNLYYKMLTENNNLFIIWQTGVESFNEMESLVKNHQHLLLRPYLQSMDLAYAAADLIISRAGAMTCYEILAAGKPAILIPSPNVAEGHQFKNASLLADVAGSRVITEDELDSITLGAAVEEILGNEALMADMSERALKAAKTGASAEIAQHILSLIESSTSKEQKI